MTNKTNKGLSSKDYITYLERQAAEIRSKAERITDDFERALMLIQARKREILLARVRNLSKCRKENAAETWHNRREI